MFEYFRSWRRKVAILTLVLACVAMFGWLRTQENFDSISLNGNPYRWVVASTDGRLHFFRTSHVTIYQYFRYFHCKPSELTGGTLRVGGRRYEPDAYEPRVEKKIKWRWDFAGFYASEFKSDIDLQSVWSNSTFNQDRQIAYLAVPYWSIVNSLTLFSAYLMFSKPRSKRTTPRSDASR